LTAFCTDLMGDPPDGKTRFVGGGLGQVALADGTRETLTQAIQTGAVAIRGHADSFDPARRMGSIALDLYLVNSWAAPLRVSLPAGAQVTPAGQPAQTLPPGADGLFALAEKKGLSFSNTLQFAVWAARGSTAEEVEQTQMVRLSRPEIAKVQSLLDESGIERVFDTNRGLNSVRYDETAERLAAAGQKLSGTAVLGSGGEAVVEGVRAADGKGVVKVCPRRGGEYYYAARFTDRPEGRVSVKLFHLATGNPVRANRGSLLMLKS